MIGRTLAVAGAVILLVAPSAFADEYRGIDRDNSSKIVVYNEGVKRVRGVRVGRVYRFVLEAFSTDIGFAYMCIKVSAAGRWSCRDTIAAGSPESIAYGSGTQFRITRKMVIGGSVTARALDVLKEPVVTRVLPVVD